MSEKIKALYELCETVSREIEEANDKIRQAGGKLSAGDIDYVDKLTHTLKSIKATIAMMEDESEEYSSRGGSYEGGLYNRGSYARGGQGGSSYARGRGRYAKRDSMGRYSSERGYSRDGAEMVDELRELMEDAPSESIRHDIERLVSKIESAGM